jgi:hypothetical protein
MIDRWRGGESTGDLYVIYHEIFVNNEKICYETAKWLTRYHTDTISGIDPIFSELHWGEVKVRHEWDKICTLAATNVQCSITTDDIMTQFAAERHKDLLHNDIDAFVKNLPPLNLCSKHAVGAASVINCVKLLLYCIKDDEDRELVRNRLRQTHFTCAMSLEHYKQIAKAIDIWAKKSQIHVREWHYLVSLLNFAGYNVVASWTDEKREEIESWLLSDYDTLPSKKDNWRRLLAQCIFDKLPKSATVIRDVSLVDFVQNTDNWVRSGAGSERVYIDGTNAGNTRAAFALNHTSEEIAALVRDPEYSPTLRPSIKVELGQRTRIFAAVDEVFNLGQAYVSRWVENAWRGPVDGLKSSTLFMKNPEQWDFWRLLHNTAEKSENYFFPYDAPSFDHKVGMNELMAVYDAIGMYLNWMRAPSDVFTVLEANRQQLLKMRVLIPQDDNVSDRSRASKYCPLRHGLPSGLRWTAVGGSLITLGRAEIASRISNGLRLDGSQRSVSQGDDLLIWATNLWRILIVYMVIKGADVGTNDAKNFIMKHGYEFLRKRHSEHGPAGYLARKIPGFMYRSPMSPGGGHWSSRMRERLQGISVMMQRGGRVRDLLSHTIGWFRRSAAKKNGMDKVMFTNWMHSPLAYGGLGMKGNASEWVGLECVQESRTAAQIADAKIKGYDDLPTCGIATELHKKWGQASSNWQALLWQRADKAKIRGREEDATFQIVRRKPVLRDIKLRYPRSKAYVRMPSDGNKLTWQSWVEAPALVMQDLARQAVRQGDEMVFLHITASDKEGVATRLFATAQMVMLYKWIEGQLDVHAPLVLGVSGLKSSRVRSLNKSIAFNWMMRQHRLGLGEFEDVAAAIEMLSRNSDEYVYVFDVGM